MKLNSRVINGSITLLVIFNLYSLLNFIFQSSMARLLSPSDYGILAFLFYFIYFIGIFTESLQTIITKYVSAEPSKGKIKNIIKRSFRRVAFISLFIILAFAPVSFALSFYLEIPLTLSLFTSLILCVSVFLPIPRGVLQGKKKFYALGFNMVIEAGVKLVFAVLFVLLGLKVFGAMSGVFLGVSSAFLLSFFLLKIFFNSEESRTSLPGFYSYSKSLFIANSAILVFYTLDIFLAQILFSKEIAGFYSIASVLSKIVFWGTQPISKALFPLVAEKSSLEKKSSTNAYFNALLLLGLGIFIALAVFAFFPDLIVRIFTGRYIEQSSSILLNLTLATSLLSVANLNILYKASMNRISHSYYFLVILAFSIVLMIFFSASLAQYSLAFLISSALFFVGSVMLLVKKN